MPEKIRRINVLGTQVSAGSFADGVDRLRQLVRRQQPAYVSCANAYSLSMSLSDKKLQSVLCRADMTTADGVPVVWAMKLLGAGNAERVHNDDLVLACCERFPEWKHYLVGGAAGQPEIVAAAMCQRFPGIDIVGVQATPIRPLPAENSLQIVAAIEKSEADIVWVGMGTPAQDFWMSEVSPELNIPLVGCGSLFDLLAGRTRAAPEWVKRNGLQWLFRLLQEPRRLLFRYSYHNTRFLFAFIWQYLSLKLKKL